MNRWSCTNNFYKKFLTGTIFLLAPASNHAWNKPIFYWLHEMAACCFFGVDLGKRLDHYSLSRLTDGTPYFFSDLPYFTLPFTWTKLFSVQTSLLSSLWTKNILSPIPILRKYSKTLPNSVLAAEPFQFYKKILSPTFFLT